MPVSVPVSVEEPGKQTLPVYQSPKNQSGDASPTGLPKIVLGLVVVLVIDSDEITAQRPSAARAAGDQSQAGFVLLVR